MSNIISIVLIILGLSVPGRDVRPQMSQVKHRPSGIINKNRFDFRKPDWFLNNLKRKACLERSRKETKSRHSGKFQLEEFPFDTTTIFGPAPGEQEVPDIAFDGTNFFVVWDDDREGDFYQIYGARVTPNGVLLDSFSIPISVGEGNRACPAVAFDGTNYFVVWMDDRNMDWVFEIYGARVTQDGGVLDSNGISISTGGGDRYYPCVAFDGTNYFVAWSDDRDGDGSFDIYGTRVTPQGEVLEPDGIPICTNPYQQMLFRSIIFGAGNYFLIWMDGRDEDDQYPNLYGARVRTDGGVLDPNGKPIIQEANLQMFPDLGFDGTNYFAVWQDDREMEEDYRIYGCRIDTNGAPIDSGGILLTNEYSEYPAIGFDGANYLVSYLLPYNYGKIYGMRISPEGAVIDTFTINPNYSYIPPAVSFGADKYFVSFSIFGLGDLDLYGARVTTEGEVLDPDGILLAYGWQNIEQQNPVAAFDGTNYLVVWEDSRNPDLNIYGTRLTPAGEILDPNGIRINYSESWQETPAIGYDGSNYFVVWTDYRNEEGDIFGCRVTKNGVVLDSEGIQISFSDYDDYAPSIAFDGTNYLVVWQSYEWLPSEEGKIWGARVAPDGQILGILEITSGDYYLSQSAVTFGDENYLVVWRDYRNDRQDIYGARVSKEGVLLDPNGIPIDTSSSFFYKQDPALSSDGDNYFVVYALSDTTNWYPDIYGKRVNQDGVVIDREPIPISTAEYEQYIPSIDFNGTNYLVVWQDYRERVSEIYGARVMPNGTVLDPEGIKLISELEDRYQPRVCCGPSPVKGVQHLLTFYGYYSPLSVNKALGALYFDELGGSKENSAFPIPNSAFRLYPNPMNRKGYLEFTLPVDGDVDVALYSVDGRMVKNLCNGRIKAGNHTIPIDSQNLPLGVYFLNLRFGDKTAKEKLLIIR
ncbi:MAG: T9SS type A sorting domain-containing protein [candidate division WOR-3 bacterium]